MTKFNPELKKDNHAYIQIADQIERGIASGELVDGDLLPSIRDLARRIHVNMSTVTRAYREAERRGIVSGTTGSGTYVNAAGPEASSMSSPEPFSRGVTEMGIVSPLPHLDPDLKDALRALSRRGNLSSYMNYSAPEGYAPHREAGRVWMKRYGAEFATDEIVVCGGSQHALSCAVLSHFREGQRIACDAYTYPGFKTLAAMCRIKIVPVPMDIHGMIPSELDAVCRREKIAGLYVMPAMQNPTASSMDERRRDGIADIASRYDLTVIEDDAFIHAAESPDTPFAARIPERVIYIAGVSKALGAGLRVAFAGARGASREKIARGVMNTSWMTPPLNAEIISGWIKDGSAEKTLDAKRRESRERNRIAKKILSGMKYSSAPCGYYIWLPVRSGVTGSAFEKKLRAKGVSVFAAERFAAGIREDDHAVRLSLVTVESREEMTKALEIVKDMMKAL